MAQFNLKSIAYSRYPYILLTGVGIALILRKISPGATYESPFVIDFITATTITWLAWEGSFYINKAMEKKWSFIEHAFKRVLAQGILTLAYTAGVIYGAMFIFQKFVCHLNSDHQEQIFFSSLIIGSLTSLIILGINIGIHLFKGWSASIRETEKHKNRTLQAELANMRSQVNPHFLFNNLNVLNSLIDADKNKAKDFVAQLAKVYRYSIEMRNMELIDLKTEMSFIQSYCYLLEIRFGKGIQMIFNIEKEEHTKMVLPMALQLLIENSIQHNETSLDKPLTIKIETKNGFLWVCNPIQLRRIKENSAQLGLENIVKRYAHYTNIKVGIDQQDGFFSVCLPLLKLT